MTSIRIRYEAPLQYEAIARAFNVLRFLGGVTILITSVFGLRWGLPTAPFVMVGAAVVMVDALRRLGAPGNPRNLLLLDATLIGAVLLIRGQAPGGEVAGFLYLLTAAMLMLPFLDALIVTGYASAWLIVVTLWSPLIEDTGITSAQVALFDRIAGMVFVSVIAMLLYAAGRALYTSNAQHQEALEQQRRAVMLKNEFVSMVSHELRTPLTSISGFAATLRETWQALEPEEVEEFIGIMIDETDHLANLVEDILVIPRLEAGRLPLHPERLDLAEEAAEAAAKVFADSEKEHVVAIPGGMYVWADRGRLRQIFRNLLENARKYGGDQILIEAIIDGDMTEVAVSDNGRGIPEADRERVFEHFEQVTKGDDRTDSGFGLGLPIARRLARAMGGDLWYEARFPVGARFVFTVKIAEIAAPQEFREPEHFDLHGRPLPADPNAPVEPAAASEAG